MSKRNFITLPSNDSLITGKNEGNVTFDYKAALVEKTTEHLSNEVKAVWANVRDITGAKKNSLGTDLLASETDQVLRQYYKGEYETWQLVNELVNADKLFFEKDVRKQIDSQVKSCPQTLEYETLVSDHASTVVHAVALWLEKVYEPDTKAQISDLDVNLCA